MIDSIEIPTAILHQQSHNNHYDFNYSTTKVK